MIEVEIKLPLRRQEKTEETGRIAEVLCSMGFRKAARFRQRDTYFDNEAGEIRGGGKALRIRETEDLMKGIVTAELNFKGPRMDQVSMTRQELETEVGQAETGRRILAALGFSPVLPEVVKERTEYRRGEITAPLDRVEGLGDFLELEILADEDRPGCRNDCSTVKSDREEPNAALHKLEALLGKLGYRMSDTVTRSYLSMLQQGRRTE